MHLIRTRFLRIRLETLLERTERTQAQCLSNEEKENLEIFPARPIQTPSVAASGTMVRTAAHRRPFMVKTTCCAHVEKLTQGTSHKPIPTLKHSPFPWPRAMTPRHLIGIICFVSCGRFISHLWLATSGIRN